MIRVLTLSTLFPDAVRPVFGPFVERQTLGLAAHPDVELQVVAPIGLPPGPLALHPHYRALAGLPHEEIWKGLRVHRPRFWHIPATSGRFDAAMEARAVLPLLRKIRRDFEFDLIDAEFFFPDGPAAIALGKAIGVPVSIKSRGGDIHLWGAQRATQQQVINAGQQANAMLSVSQALKSDMVALGMPADRIQVHYTGVDLSLFRPGFREEAKAALGIKGPLVVCVGTLMARKGQALVIDALATQADVSLALVGQGPDRAALEHQIAACDMTGRVQFTGSLPQTGIVQWLAAADVVALPSISEGLANVWVEALASGTPIVISDVGGARELLTDHRGGRVVNRTVADVSAAIADLLENPPPASEMRAIAERFTWEANTAALYDHFKAMVDSGSNSRR